ncbi:ABC transporter ATP-binding protein [Rhodococcus sp. D2-41]|uniref:Fatty acid ABC transporter ATP-binding/permease protein n=1 Tax=Speluncibacter jeojiensis TaxID=2710754 RepID=A0A9X4M677_9ACTN|nr:ABC transporter ATP-binding protein [Rhodococcus sp. D2-41]MDG3011155.1 ABC transporter ATP-binding protein [Rhodococcus sp. D2-41]MDG3015993.1 ABC transporter ATP-binding protein/permease [Corynebacteriales bacterium D3-21]
MSAPMGAGAPGQKSKNFRAAMKRLVEQLRPEKTRAIGILAVTVASIVLSVIGPKILGRATDLIFAGVIGRQLPPGISKDQAVAALRAEGNSTFADMVSGMSVTPGHGIDFGAVANVLALAMAVYVLSSVLAWAGAYLLNIVVQRTVYRLRAQVEAKLHRVPLGYFDRQPRGELLSRVTNDIDNIQMTLGQTMSQLVTSVLTVFGVLAMMFVISPTLTGVSLIVVPISFIIVAIVGRRSQRHFKAQWMETGRLNSQIEETYSGHVLVRVYGHQGEVERDFGDRNQKLYEAGFGAQFLSGLIMPLMSFVGNLIYVAVAVIGGLKVANGSMSLGNVQAFIQYSRQFSQPLTQIASMANSLQSGAASAERVFELLDEPEQTPDPEVPVSPGPTTRGRVEFEHISFRYQPDTPLIEDLSLVAEPGQTVAIVGPTGAGKTTLVNLIMRFYELDAGRITLDGVDVAQMRRSDLRGRVGMVLQDTWLFGGTIRDNIAYGRPDASEEDIERAAQATFVDRFVHTLPDGYDTVIDEEAGNVSAGQKQLITIARAFLAQPSLLILDEATSSVDTRTEALVQHAMAALRSDRTSFIIAHRLSTIRDADLILVMEKGQIVEQGTHAELLEREGAYARLYNAQFVGAIS